MSSQASLKIMNVLDEPCMKCPEASYPNGSWQVQQCHLQVVRIGIRIEIPGTEAAAWTLHSASLIKTALSVLFQSPIVVLLMLLVFAGNDGPQLTQISVKKF